MSRPHFPVDSDRLRRDIERNAQFGAVGSAEGMGRTVLPGTIENQRARENLVDRMIDANLTVEVDAVGNLTGVWMPEGCPPDAAPVAAGSHLDSVPSGGIFDGPLGVYGALEAVRAMQDAGAVVDRPLMIVCFTGEEGTRFADGVLGSSVAAGELDAGDALALTDGSETLRDALTEIGFQGEEPLDASDWHAWLELHVEQGKRLEQQGAAAGIVTAIAGTVRLEVTIEGEANHTGTTPMGERTDALAAASEFVLGLEQAGRTAAENNSGTAVATVGDMTVVPGAVNVVPGTVTLGVDIRDIDVEIINHLVERVESIVETLEAERDVTVTVERPYDIAPTDMAPVCRDACHEAARVVGVETIDLHSGAGHDTMQIANVTDAGLVFAPSEGGHSHNPLEWTDWDDCVTTTELLAAALGSLAGASVPVDEEPTR